MLSFAYDFEGGITPFSPRIIPNYLWKLSLDYVDEHFVWIAQTSTFINNEMTRKETEHQNALQSVHKQRLEFARKRIQ